MHSSGSVGSCIVVKQLLPWRMTVAIDEKLVDDYVDRVYKLVTLSPLTRDEIREVIHRVEVRTVSIPVLRFVGR